MSANVVSPLFIGRRDEMRSLERLVDRARSGDAAFALIGGEAGVAIPASIGGIAAGSLLAPVLASSLGLTGALLACGAAVLGYAALLLRGTGSPAPAAAPALDEVLAG